MPLPVRHVFICGNLRPAENPRGSCGAKGSDAVRAALKQAVAERGLKPQVKITQTTCLDQCEHGISVVVYPEQVWYGFVKTADVPEIVDRHLANGQPVERLRLSSECVHTASCPHRVAT